MKGGTGQSDFVKSLRARIGSGFFFNLIGAGFNQGSTLVVNLLVSNLFGPRVFGEYAAIQTTVAVGAGVASFGTGYTATKYVAELRSADPRRASRILGLCALVTAMAAAMTMLIVLFGAAEISSRALRAPKLALALRIASPAIFFNVWNGFVTGALLGLESYRSLARAGLMSGVAYVALCFGGALLGGLEGTLAGVALSSMVQAGLLCFFLLREAGTQGLRIDGTGVWKEGRVLWRFALPAALPGFTTMPSIWLASLVLLRQPGGYTEMGLYSAGYNIRTVTLFLPTVLAGVTLSVLNNEVRARDQARYWTVVRLGLGLTATVSVLMAMVFAGAGRPVLRLFGNGFDRAYVPLLILLVGAVFESLWTVVAQIVSSRERMWSLLIFSTLPRDSLLVLLAVALVPRQAATGLAASYALAWFVALLLAASLAWRTRTARIPLGNEEMTDHR